jgi:hypothetical protein
MYKNIARGEGVRIVEFILSQVFNYRVQIDDDLKEAKKKVAN